MVLSIALGGCGSMSVGSGAGASASAAGYVTQVRAENDMPPLRSDSKLEAAALDQARLMAASGSMEHTTGWRSDFATRMARHDIPGPAAENIAAGRFDARKVIEVWRDSPPHRRNMLDARMTRFGLAYATSDKDPAVRYWAMVLAK
jgi:uncharacterized protein YkwD